MQSFNILDRSTSIGCSRLLEASAGTGKTFTIEHLFVRFLLEGTAPCRIPQILVVTFTRAAARDLKVRIRGCLEKAVRALKSSALSKEIPDYLAAVLDQGEDAARKACRLLEDALFCFDEAQIFTIHGFCARALKEHALESNLSLEIALDEKKVSREFINALIGDFFRSGLALKLMGNENLHGLWDSYDGKYSGLETDLRKAIINKTGIALTSSMETSDALFAAAAHHCQKLLRRRLYEEEMLGPDELLDSMLQAAHSPEFCNCLRQKVRVAIIDEFQDTDPVQWAIFERLFISSNGQKIPVYLVGDPKQSIYAFRHADIYTYLKAGEALPQKATLDTNYRSRPSLVNALNVLFSAANAPNLMPLPRIGADLPYREAQSSERCPSKAFNDGFSDINFLFSDDDFKKEELLWNFIASQIQRLHAQVGIPYKEMAVLISDRYKGAEIAQYLQRHQIPCSNQRSGSLSDSTAIKDWKDILQAALAPRNLSAVKAAMAAPVIGWTHAELREIENSGRMITLLAHWQGLRKSLAEGFGAFFEHFISHRWLPEGESVMERLLGLDGGLELYEEFFQIGERLLEYHSQTQCLGLGLVKYLDELEEEEEDGDEAAVLRHDPSRDAVNLLTTFASKGLEYDIVFAPGLLKSKEVKDRLIPVFHQGQLRREAAVPGSDASRKHREEIDAEKMRQLYVAMTRARYRLYLPAEWGPIPKAAPGKASAMRLFLARLGQLPTDSDGLYERLQKGLKDRLVQFFGQLDPSSGISYRVLDQRELPSEGIQPHAKIPEMVPPPKVAVAQPELFMHSFTSLAKKSSSGALESQAILSPPHDFNCPDHTPHTLPSGSETGNLLHSLIENLPLGIALKARSASDLYPWVLSRLKGTIYHGWEESVALILFQAFNLPLEGPNGRFTLAEIDPECWYREMEFLYPCNEGYLKGTIDCAIQHQGFSYIIDWKSNWLGPGAESYNRASLERSMQENCYGLQAEIYAEAWRRYCGHLNRGKQAAVFGGIYYMFLRGPGVVYCPPEGGFKC